MTFYIYYISDNPDALICSPGTYRKLGIELLGLLLYPDVCCQDGWLYAVNMDELSKATTIFIDK